MDIDLGVVVSTQQLSQLDESATSEIRSMAGAEGRAVLRTRYSVDVYFIDSMDFKMRRYYTELFSRNVDAETEKGIPFIKL